jgi:putative membrane protein
VREGSLLAETLKTGKVPYGEQSRKYRRTVFSHDDWVDHRSSSSRILSNLQKMLVSGVVRQLRPQVAVVSGVAAFVLIWNLGVVPALSLPILSLPAVPFTLSSPALGLLLVFRTNASYARWMEARNTWARMTTHSSNLVRMGSIFCEDTAALETLSLAVWVYCRTVMNQLSSPQEDNELYRSKVASVFEKDPAVGQRILNSRDRTMAAWKHLSQSLHSLPVADTKALIETDKSIIILGECAATCEKIYTSPVPLVYTRHTARFLSLWALLLPFALFSTFQQVGGVLAVLPATAILSFFLFGVDELAMQLEEPFSILPMEAFCDQILASTSVLVGSDYDED